MFSASVRRTASMCLQRKPKRWQRPVKSGQVQAQASPSNETVYRLPLLATIQVHMSYGQDHHLHIAVQQGSLRPGHAVVLELVLQDWGWGSHRVCISLLSCQKTNVWGLVSDVGWESCA